VADMREVARSRGSHLPPHALVLALAKCGLGLVLHCARRVDLGSVDLAHRVTEARGREEDSYLAASGPTQPVNTGYYHQKLSFANKARLKRPAHLTC
jgi:hypothetical protein